MMYLNETSTLQLTAGGSIFSYAPCFVNLAPAAIAASAIGVNIAPSLAVITPEGINIQPQGLNIQPVSCYPSLKSMSAWMFRSG